MVAGGGLEGGQGPEDVERFEGLVEEDAVAYRAVGFAVWVDDCRKLAGLLMLYGVWCG